MAFRQLPTKKGLSLILPSDGQNSGPTVSHIDRLYVGEALEAN